MLKKGMGHLGAVLKESLYWGFGVQILLGLVWMGRNFSAIQTFAESKSFLYRGLFRLTGSHAQIMYLLQLIFGIAAADFFFNSLSQASTGKRVFRSLALVTFPMAMQCHLALGVWSFSGSLLFVQAGCAARIWLEKSGEKQQLYRRLAGILTCWILLSLLMPEYRLFGGILTVVTAVVLLCRQKRGKIRLQILLFTLCGALLATGAGTGTAALSGEKHRSLEFSMASRFAWFFILSDFYGWPEEVLEALGESVREITFYPDNMERVMQSLMEEAFGEKGADAYYRQIAWNALENRWKNILTYLRWDMVGYGAAPIAVQKQLEGGYYDACTAENYEKMREQAPEWTKLYLSYSCWWFQAMLGIAFLILLADWIQRGHFPLKQELPALLPLILTVVVMIFWYTMRGAGLMDYKEGFAISSLWLALALLLLKEEKGKDGLAEKQKFS